MVFLVEVYAILIATCWNMEAGLSRTRTRRVYLRANFEAKSEEKLRGKKQYNWNGFSAIAILMLLLFS